MVSFLNILQRSLMQWSPVILGVLLAGCGDSSAPSLYPASGTIKLNGAPLPEAQITFVPQKGPVAMGISDLEGNFKLKTGSTAGVVAGNCKVSVVVSAGSDGGPLSKDMTPEDMQQMQMDGTLEAAMAQQNKSLIPEKYTNAETSGLSYEVTKAGPNEFSIDLK